MPQNRLRKEQNLTPAVLLAEALLNEIPFVVHPAGALLALGTCRACALPARLASIIALSNRRHCRGRGVKPGVGGDHVAGAGAACNLGGGFKPPAGP